MPKVELTTLTKGRHTLPALKISYDLHELMGMASFFRLLMERSIVPHIYLINERSSEPQVLLTFEVVGVPHGRLVKFFGSEIVKQMVLPEIPVKLLTTASCRVHRYKLHSFLDIFKVYKEVYVVITEDTQTLRSGPIDATLFFAVSRLERTVPEHLFMY